MLPSTFGKSILLGKVEKDFATILLVDIPAFLGDLHKTEPILPIITSNIGTYSIVKLGKTTVSVSKLSFRIMWASPELGSHA